MNRRLDLHDDLLNFSNDVYYQPPSGYKLRYPCIIYRKTGWDKIHADNSVYLKKQEYNIMVIDTNPDSNIAEEIESYFEHCSIEQYYVTDNLNHITLKLYY